MKSKLLKALSQAIVLADFKSVEKKFIGQDIDKDEVQRYIGLFKELKNNQRIQSIEDKNIDNWGKRPWEEFKEFVDNLKAEKSKAEEKKLQKMEGAELIAEDDNWRVYKITSHEACRIYGSGTKWCITGPTSQWWDKYTRRNNFYFILSKNRASNDPWYKIAAQISRAGKKTYWDAEDKDHSTLPDDLKMVKFDFLYDGKDKGTQSNVESIIDDLNEYAEDQEEYYTDINNDYASYIYEQDIELRYVDDDVRENLDILMELCEKLGLDFEDTVKNDTTKIEYETSYYRNHNEISRFNIGDQECELSDELKDALDDLTDEEKKEVEHGVNQGYLSINRGTINVLGDNDCFVLIIDEDLLAEKIEELQENKAIIDEKDLSTIDKTVLTGKSPSSRIKAIEKTKNQEVLEKAYTEDKIASVRLAAASKIKNQKLLDEIVLKKEEADDVKVAAIKNKNFDNDDLLKKVVEEYSLDDDSTDAWPWSIYTAAFDKIKDMKWLNKYVLKPKVNPHIRETLVERIAKKMRGKKSKAYVDYLKKLAAIMTVDGQTGNLGVIIKELPDSEQDFFKEIALTEEKSQSWGGAKDVRQIALSRIKDENFLKDFIKNNLKDVSKDSELIEAALTGIKDQKYLEKCLTNKKFEPVADTLIKLIDNDRLVADYILKTETGSLLGDSKIQDQKILQELVLEPKFYDWYKEGIVNRLDVDSLKTLIKKLPKAIKKHDDLRDTFRYMRDRAKELKNTQLEEKLDALHKHHDKKYSERD